MEDLLAVEGLAKRYDGFALEDIAITVPSGTVVGLIGSNGAGKTTTLKALLGMIEADGKRGRILGQAIEAAPDDLKQCIGVVLDTCSFPESLCVREVGALGQAAYRRWDASLVAGFGLEPRKTVKQLSRGMGMKLSLAFALAHHPQLLVLDEATAGLDPLARDEMLDLLRRFMEEDGHGILMSTHITTDLEKIADEIICIDGGRIIFDLPKEAICDRAGIARCRTADLEALEADGFLASEGVRYLAGSYSTDLLVPDRFAFAEAYPKIAVDRASVEEYMALRLKGQKGGSL